MNTFEKIAGLLFNLTFIAVITGLGLMVTAIGLSAIIAVVKGGM